jgi:hypothetical protein
LDSPDNPVIPTYNQDPPLINKNAVWDTGNIEFFHLKDFGKDTLVFAGQDIRVDDFSDSLTDKFQVSSDPEIALSAILALVAKSQDVVKSNPVLWGIVIDRVELAWVYNHDIIIQNVDNDGGIINPVTEPVIRDYNFIGQSIDKVDTEFSITGEDSDGNEASDNKLIQFGNYRVWGVGPRYDYNANNLGAPYTYSQLKTFLEALLNTTGTKELTTTRVKNVFAQGGNLEHFFYIFPKRWGFATFTKYFFVGGMVRLKRNASNDIEIATDFYAYDSGEQDIQVNNGQADDPFLVYMSINDNIADNVEPLKIT